MPKYIWDENIQAPKLVPGSHEYRSTWACFDCRTAFTRTRPTPQPDEVVCPDCGQLAADMGYLFSPPAKRNVRQWNIMKLLARHRLRFHRSGMVSFIDHFITNYGKSTPAEVKRNISRYIRVKRR